MVKSIISIMIIATVLLTGCYSANFCAKTGAVSMSPSKGKVVGTYSERLTASYLINGLVPLKNAKVDVSKLAGGKKLSSLTIKNYRSFGNLLISGLTFGIYTPKTVKIKANINE